MKEKDLQIIFGRKNKKIGAFELKMVKGISIPFSRIEEHQILSLAECEKKGLYHKIADQTIGKFGYGSSMKKPCDCFNTPPMPAYLVIIWYVPRKRKTAYYIRINDFVSMAINTERKSATEKMCADCCEDIVEL